jgi:hypothetical protein
MKLCIVVLFSAIITGCGGSTQETASAPNDPFAEVLTAQTSQDKSSSAVSNPVDPFKQYILSH